jgi:hypothetical protein
MAIDVGVADLPRSWRGPFAVGSVLVMGGSLAQACYFGIAHVARAEAATTTREVLAEDIAQFKGEALTAATTAAREGANQAVRDAVGPLAEKIADVDKRQVGHEREDDSRVHELQRRVAQIETRRR